MRLRSSALALLLALPLAAARVEGPAVMRSVFHFHAEGADAGPWQEILSAGGFLPGDAESAGIVVGDGGTAEEAAAWSERVERGTFLVITGDSELAGAFGFRPGEKRVRVRSVVDARMGRLPIIWERAVDVPVWEMPADAKVFVRERWSGAPLVAGIQRGLGGVLWLAVGPGRTGHERFPYLLQALRDLGAGPPFRSRRLWAFFDSSYRTRADIAWFARRWRASGLAALHVAAWHYFEPDTERDAWLGRLIEECHRNAIQVYAWLELPHVSEQFWRDHPEWREQTAIQQDAHLDWRKLMNLENPECSRAVAAGVQRLIDRFDWDGVNLAELYFESLEGHENPAWFTPMNADVRTGFEQLHGFDPLEIFTGARFGDPASLRLFLDYRTELARSLQEKWISEINEARRRKPHLDLVLTHVDDRLDGAMRDKIGADSARTLPLLERYDFTFLVEDPATVWDRGPERYTEIAEEYKPLAPRAEKLAIDINVVERYQDVYPTKQQTGTEMLRQVRLAALAFPRVALYAEHSLLRPDLDFLPSAAASVERVERTGVGLVIASRYGAGVPWTGPASVDGRPWPVTGDGAVWVPAGEHTIEPAATGPAFALRDFNGELDSAVALRDGLEIAYRSSTRAFARLDQRPARVEIDGLEEAIEIIEDGNEFVLFLPRGQHLATFYVR